MAKPPHDPIRTRVRRSISRANAEREKSSESPTRRPATEKRETDEIEKATNPLYEEYPPMTAGTAAALRLDEEAETRSGDDEKTSDIKAEANLDAGVVNAPTLESEPDGTVVDWLLRRKGRN